LGKLRDRNAIKLLVKVLGDCYPNVQEAAAEALSLIGGELLVALLKGLANHAQSPQRCHAITLLGRLAPEESLPEITLALKDEDPHVRKAAVEAMGETRSPESDSAIIRSLADEDPMVRLATLSVLFQRKEIACLQHVEPLVKDENIWVRAAVARGLGDQGGPVKPFLLELLRDKVGVVQIAAMEALGKLRDASVVPIILSMTETQDADVREAAIASLGQLGDGSVKEALRTFLDDSHWGVRAAAATALGRLQDNLVRDSLLRLATQDQDALVRQSAQFALDQLQEP
jgi:HEAT repeat protein